MQNFDLAIKYFILQVNVILYPNVLKQLFICSRFQDGSVYVQFEHILDYTLTLPVKQFLQVISYFYIFTLAVYHPFECSYLG